MIECISWLINVTDINDARWKPEIIKYIPICSFPVLKRFLTETRTSGFSDLLTRNKNFLCQQLIKKCQYQLLKQKEKKAHSPFCRQCTQLHFWQHSNPSFQTKIPCLASNNRCKNYVTEHFDVVAKNWNFIYKVLCFETRKYNSNNEIMYVCLSQSLAVNAFE